MPLAPAPDGFPDAEALDPARLAPAMDRSDRTGRHVVLADPAGEHRLWLLPAPPGRGLAVVLPRDRTFRVRLESALRLHRRLDGRPAGPAPRGWRLTRNQRRRYALMLNAVDGRLAGASYRAIAVALIDQDLAELPARDWKVSSARAQVQRLVAEGLANVDGGYRDILAGA